MKVSIVVPMYNCENTICVCIESVLKQSYSDWELILVDDGSTDDTVNALTKYLINPQIKLINQKNSGPGSARNKGIEYANGKYLTFLDSDDKYKEKYIETLVGLMEGDDSVQLAVCNFCYVNKENDNNNREKVKKITNVEALNIMLYQEEFDTTVWGKLFILEIAKTIKFPSIHFAEDSVFCIEYLKKCTGVIYSNEKLYEYFYSPESLMNNPNHFFKEKCILDVFHSYMDWAEKNCDALYGGFVRRYVFSLNHIYVRARLIQKDVDNYLAYEKEILKYKEQLLLDKRAKIKDKVAIVLLGINPNLYIFIFKIIKTIKNKRKRNHDIY